MNLKPWQAATLIGGALAAICLVCVAAWLVLDDLLPAQSTPTLPLVRLATLELEPLITDTFRPIKMPGTQTPVTPAARAVTWTPYGAVCSCDRNQYNCGDFSSPEAAQVCYKFCIAKGAGDVHRLDGDKDGIVCEMTE